jgi:NitT/TauT family transport system substrate-binding protein
MPADSIHFLRVDGAAKLVAVLDNRAVGALGGIENQALILEQRGLPVTTMLYSSMGVNSIGLAILTSADTEQTKPDLVRRFVAATRASFELAAKDPDAAIVALLAAKPTLEHDLSMKQLVTALPLMRSLHGPEQPVGWMAPEDWADTLALMKEYQGLQTDMPATAFWTDAYLPK